MSTLLLLHRPDTQSRTCSPGYTPDPRDAGALGQRQNLRRVQRLARSPRPDEPPSAARSARRPPCSRLHMSHKGHPGTREPGPNPGRSAAPAEAAEVRPPPDPPAVRPGRPAARSRHGTTAARRRTGAPADTAPAAGVAGTPQAESRAPRHPPAAPPKSSSESAHARADRRRDRPAPVPARPRGGRAHAHPVGASRADAGRRT